MPPPSLSILRISTIETSWSQGESLHRMGERPGCKGPALAVLKRLKIYFGILISVNHFFTNAFLSGIIKTFSRR